MKTFYGNEIVANLWFQTKLIDSSMVKSQYVFMYSNFTTTINEQSNPQTWSEKNIR